jgi:hypothetical protein
MSDEQVVEPSQPAGLLDGVEATEESQQEPSEASAVDHRADDSIPEDEPLDRPDWWPENFWKEGEPDLQGIAKSWMDMRKMVSQGKHKAPPEGKYSTEAFGENAEQLPMVPVFTKWAAENGISQSAYDQLATQLNEMASEMNQGPEIDVQAELKSLGPNANAIKNGMVNWARGLVNKGVWGPEDFEEFKVMGGTARGLKALMKVRESYEGRIPVESAPIDGAPTDQELQQMVGDPRYQTDVGYRQKVEKLFNQRYN